MDMSEAKIKHRHRIDPDSRGRDIIPYPVVSPRLGFATPRVVFHKLAFNKAPVHGMHKEAKEEAPCSPADKNESERALTII